jgi:ABC-type spermidine/putrescine transport system permease subunit II
MLEQLTNFTFLNKAATFSIPDIIAALFVSFALGLFIFFVYTRTFKGVMHSSSFGISLIAMNLITTLIIMAVSSNLITSLGMVGALSIVRFRTVVKEPLDLVYLFWAITAGIVVGVGLLPLAVIGSLVIGLILYIFVNRKTNDIPYVVVVSCTGDEAEEQSLQLLKSQTKKHVIKAKSVSREGVELTVEVRLSSSSSQFVNALLKIDGVMNATLVSYNGDYYM